MKALMTILIIFSLLLFGCDSPTDEGGKEIIDVTLPNGNSVWLELQTNTTCEWNNAKGETVYIEVYKGGTYLGLFSDETENDGTFLRTAALGNWGTGTNYRLKVIDAKDNFGWSDYFSIISAAGQIEIIYPVSSTIWAEFQIDTYCDWINAAGDSVYIEIYKGNTLKGQYHNWTNNDGHCTHNGPLADWGAGTDFRLKLTDALGNSGWSDYFTILAVTPGQIFVIYPTSSTIWQEHQVGTVCDWSNASGDSLYIEIYKGSNLKGIYHEWTNNDGHCKRNVALDDWGTGSDFRLKLIDSDGMEGWSEYFTIEAFTPGPIIVIYPNSTTVWQEFEEGTYCDWTNATGNTVYIEIYNGSNYLDIYHEETANDGHCKRNGPLGDWGTGSNFKLKVIDANSNYGWSEYFTIE